MCHRSLLDIMASFQRHILNKWETCNEPETADCWGRGTFGALTALTAQNTPESVATTSKIFFQRKINWWTVPLPTPQPVFFCLVEKYVPATAMGHWPEASLAASTAETPCSVWRDCNFKNFSLSCRNFGNFKADSQCHTHCRSVSRERSVLLFTRGQIPQVLRLCLVHKGSGFPLGAAVARFGITMSMYVYELLEISTKGNDMQVIQ